MPHNVNDVGLSEDMSDLPEGQPEWLRTDSAAQMRLARSLGLRLEVPKYAALSVPDRKQTADCSDQMFHILGLIQKDQDASNPSCTPKMKHLVRKHYLQLRPASSEEERSEMGFQHIFQAYHFLQGPINFNSADTPASKIDRHLFMFVFKTDIAHAILCLCQGLRTEMMVHISTDSVIEVLHQSLATLIDSVAVLGSDGKDISCLVTAVQTMLLKDMDIERMRNEIMKATESTRRNMEKFKEKLLPTDAGRNSEELGQIGTPFNISDIDSLDSNFFGTH